MPNALLHAELADNDLFSEMPVRTVGQIVSGDLLTCEPDLPVAEAARLMRASRCSSVIILRDGFPAGIWTENDALNVDFSSPEAFEQPISAVMTRAVKTIDTGASISEAGVRFKRDKIRHLLVVDDDGHALGMLSQTDVVLNHGVEHYLTFRDVRSVLSKPLTSLPADMPLTQAAAAIRSSNGEAAIVTSPDWPEPGIVTERDIVRMVAERCSGPVAQATSRPVVSVLSTTTLLAARNLFSQHGFRHLAVRDDTGAFIGLLSFSDILSILQYEYLAQVNSALRDRDDALVKSRKDLNLARQVIEATLDGVMIVDDQGLIEYVNPSFSRLTGYAAEDVLGKNPRLLQSGRHDAAFYAKMWSELLDIGHWQGEVWNRRKDGDIFAEWLTINSIRDDAGGIAKYAAIFGDITEKKRDEERVRNLAYCDPLTGLPNRRLMVDRLALALANAHRHGTVLAVMFLDLDLFKRINDTLGHDVGDAVLVEVAKRLNTCVREGDTVARIGGDEFVVVMPELEDVSDAARLAERVIAAVKALMALAGRELYVTTSVGIAVYPEDGAEPEALLKCADLALYRAKEIGRNGYQLYSAAINARSAERLSMEGHLRHALANGEMSLAYQVKVDMTSGTISGAEALVRWTHPELGSVPPAEFIPLAERCGLMPGLGEWILRTACAQNQAWLNRGLPPIRMAVNLSPRQFLKGDLADTVIRVLRDTALPAHLLEVELTETAIIDHPTEVGRVLDRLHAVGVRIAIDDFGTRQSSLMALRHLPIDALKIDHSFIEGLGHAFQEKDIVVAIIRLAHALGMTAVAEGVEREHQVEVLRNGGCDEIQGYLIGRAVSPEDLETLFDRQLLPSG